MNLKEADFSDRVQQGHTTKENTGEYNFVRLKVSAHQENIIKYKYGTE
jgi:hypothetical protein